MPGDGPDYNIVLEPGYANSLEAAFGPGPFWAPGSTFTYSFEGMTTLQREFVRAAFKQWSDILNINFQEASSGGVRINLGPLTDAGGVTYGMGPNATRITINQDYASAMDLDDLGSNYTGAVFSTVVHEIGHALGLNHPGPYNGTGFTEMDALFYQDTEGYSVMSYWNADNSITDNWTSVDFEFDGYDPITPMVLDIIMLQRRTGAATNTRTGSDTYFYNAPEGSAFRIDYSSDMFVGVIYDNGGSDTIDLSLAINPQSVVLTAPTLIGARDQIAEYGTWNDILGGKSNLFIWYNAVIEKIIGGYDDDFFRARDGVNSTLIGGSGADVLYGGTGNDRLEEGDDFDADSLYGEAGTDTYFGGVGDTIVDTSGNSTVTISGFGNAYEDWVYLTLVDGNDTVTVSGDLPINAELYGGIDRYIGSDGTDYVYVYIGDAMSGTGDDIDLGGGDDGVIAYFGSSWGSGQDTIDGGSGFDSFRGNFALELSITDLDTGITDLSSLSARLSLLNFEEVTFQGTKTIVAAHGAPSLSGATITTGNGNDTIKLRYDSAYTAVNAGEGNDRVESNIDDLFADHAIGDYPGSPFATTGRAIDLGGGNDTLFANLMTLGTHTYAGGTGTDTLDMSVFGVRWTDWERSNSVHIRSRQVVVNDDIGLVVASGVRASNNSGYTFSANISGFETYTLLNDAYMHFFGHSTEARTVNLVMSPSGYPKIENRPSDVIVAFGSGADRLNVDDLNSRRATSGPAGQFTFDGSSGKDILDFSGLSSIYTQLRNTDTTTVGPIEAEESFVIDAAAGTFTRQFNYGVTGATYDNRAEGTISGFEVYYLPDYVPGGPLEAGLQHYATNRFIGSDAAETVFGGARGDSIEGGGGSDSLVGGGGSDTLIGGAGNDVYVIDGSSDLVIDGTGISFGTDTVRSSVSVDLQDATRFSGDIEKVTLSGSANRQILGNSLANTLTGNGGANTIDGRGGDDTMAGGLGDDTYILGSGDSLVEGADAGSDTVKSSGSFTLATNFENLILTGTANRSGTGNAAKNVLTGNDGNNKLSGLDAADTLLGGNGNDTLEGGSGADRAEGGIGDDTYVFRSGDTLVEKANAGTDTVSSSETFTLAINFENLTLTGTGTAHGTGNSAKNIVLGNDGSNKLSGLAADDTLTGGKGNDTLIGGTGKDSLEGGAGKDTFRFDVALSVTNADVIKDFVVADDTIQLQKSIFTKLGAVGNTIGSAAFHSSTTGKAHDTSDRVLYETDTGRLTYDADGTGGSAAVLIATLSKNLLLTEKDFAIV